MISPWNFPVAIPLGMVAAGLATGNAVRAQAGRAGARAARSLLVRALREAGVPPDALALLPGEGDVGAALVERPARAHDRLHRLERGRAGDRPHAPPRCAAGQRHLKRVVAEMGGKNCVIVDSDADLDEVVPALVQVRVRLRGPEVLGRRARARATRRSTTRCVERLAGAVEVLAGRPGRADLDDRRAAGDRARGAGARRPLRRRGASATGRIAARAARGARRAAGSPRPTLAADLPADSPVLNEEIFGPLLAVERVRDVEDACDRVDASPFALTGGLFARNPDTVDYVVDALAGRQPLRQPRDHRRDGRPPAVRRQPALRHRHQGRRPRLPAPVRRAARGDREHHAPRARRLKDCPSGPARAGTVAP